MHLRGFRNPGGGTEGKPLVRKTIRRKNSSGSILAKKCCNENPTSENPDRSMHDPGQFLPCPGHLFS